jgi:hypothetical protein
MRLCSLASILAVRPFAHSSLKALLRNVLITGAHVSLLLTYVN